MYTSLYVDSRAFDGQFNTHSNRNLTIKEPLGGWWMGEGAVRCEATVLFNPECLCVRGQDMPQ